MASFLTRNFLKSLRVSVEEYIDQNPECTIEDIYENFDEPEEAVYNYISALDQTDLCKRVLICAELYEMF